MSDRIATIMLALLISYKLIVFPIAIRGVTLQSVELLGVSTVLSSIYFLVVAVIYLLKSYGIIK